MQVARAALCWGEGIVSGAGHRRNRRGPTGSRGARPYSTDRAAAHRFAAAATSFISISQRLPRGSVGNASRSPPHHRAPRGSPPARERASRGEATGAAITLTGNGELMVEYVTPFVTATPRGGCRFQMCGPRRRRTCSSAAGLWRRSRSHVGAVPRPASRGSSRPSTIA